MGRAYDRAGSRYWADCSRESVGCAARTFPERHMNHPEIMADMRGVRRSRSVIHVPCLDQLSMTALLGAVIAAAAFPWPSFGLGMAEAPLTLQESPINSAEAKSQVEIPPAPGTRKATAPAEEARSRFGYGLMIAHEQVREDLLVPLRWSGPSVGLLLQWERSAAMSRQSVRALIPASFYENRFGHDGYGLGLEIAYSYLRKARDDFGRGHLFFGGQVKWDVHHGYYESWDEEHIYWLGAYSLGPRLTWNRARGDNTRLAAELDLPLIALVSRPPLERLNKADPRTKPSFYFTSPHRDIEFAGPFEYKAVHGGISVTRRWGRSSLVFSYDLELVTYDEPERVITLSNRFSIVRRAW